jgi:hypothetical protein
MQTINNSERRIIMSKFRALLVTIAVLSIAFTVVKNVRNEAKVEVSKGYETEDDSHAWIDCSQMKEDLRTYLAIEESGILDETEDIKYDDEGYISYVYINTTDGHRHSARTQMEYIERVVAQGYDDQI